MRDESRKAGRTTGIILIGVTMLALAAMAHHPVAGGADAAELVENMNRIAGLSRAVHATMIAVTLLLLYALAAHAHARGLDRPSVMAGLVFYGAGSILMLIPPALNGFMPSDLAARAGAAGADGLPILVDMMRFGFHIAATFAKLAIVLMGTGIAFWSGGLVLQPGATRWVGALGLAAGLLPVLAILSGAVPLDVVGMTAIIAAWGFWYVGMGILMVRKVI